MGLVANEQALIPHPNPSPEGEGLKIDQASSAIFLAFSTASLMPPTM